MSAAEKQHPQQDPAPEIRDPRADRPADLAAEIARIKESMLAAGGFMDAKRQKFGGAIKGEGTHIGRIARGETS